VVFRPIHYARTSRTKQGAGSGIRPTNDAGRMGKVRGNKRGSEPVDGELAVYAEEKAVSKWI
jgi:hypothetical protein